jgi:hypothetical protein
MEIEFVKLWAVPSDTTTLAYQVVSLEDPYHPQDVGFAVSYKKAEEMAKAYDDERDTSMYGGRGIKIYQIAIQG